MKTIAITGASGGIGRAIALLLSKHNVAIVAVGRDKNEIDRLCSDITSKGGVCSGYAADLGDYSAVEQLAQQIKERGQIDWLINTIGWINESGAIEDENEQSIIKSFQSNILAVVYLVKFFLPFLRRGGGILTLSSTAGISGNGKHSVYSAAKGAVNTFTQAIARHIAPRDLASIAICPGPTNTLMREKIAHDAAKHQSPDVIAKLMLNIVEEKSKYKNGDIVTIKDGVDELFSELTS